MGKLPIPDQICFRRRSRASVPSCWPSSSHALTNVSILKLSKSLELKGWHFSVFFGSRNECNDECDLRSLQLLRLDSVAFMKAFCEEHDLAVTHCTSRKNLASGDPKMGLTAGVVGAFAKRDRTSGVSTPKCPHRRHCTRTHFSIRTQNPQFEPLPRHDQHSVNM